jgi:uncharacterized protein
MRRRDKEITDPRTIEGILSSSRICRLAMVDHGEPYLVPLNFGYSNGALYFHSAAAGRKIDCLRQSGRVCFEIEDQTEIIRNDVPCEWSTRYRSVIGYGVVEFITDDDAKSAALDIIMAQHGKQGPHRYDRNQVRSILALKLTIEHMTAKQSGDWNED